jgi:hypothetical protein
MAAMLNVTDCQPRRLSAGNVLMLSSAADVTITNAKSPIRSDVVVDVFASVDECRCI